jgi:hypothetical protein
MYVVPIWLVIPVLLLILHGESKLVKVPMMAVKE